jgi:restriction endonuclease Mrr
MAQVRVNQKQVLSLAQLQEEDIIADTQQSFVINEKKEENEKIATGTAKVDVVVTVNQELEQQQKAIVDEKVALLAQEKVHAKKKTSAKVCLKVTGLYFVFWPAQL